MRHLGFDEKIVRILEALYKDTASAVRVDGELSDWFSTMIGVLQGCVLSPLLFNMLLEVVMLLALSHSDLGVSISGSVISNLRFVDDISLLDNNPFDLQVLVDNVNDSSSRFGLQISEAKTEVQVIGRGPPQAKVDIQLGGISLKQVSQFVYLGGVISSDARCDQHSSQN